MPETRTSGAGTAPAPDDVVLGRYRLVDKVGDTSGTALWRGFDQRLQRPVSVRFVALDDPVAARLRDAALLASHVTDSRAVHVLDTVADPESGRLVIVTEWLVGTSLAEHIARRGGEPLPPREAATLALHVARALEAAGEAGVTHGHVRPELVMITETGDVRVRGLGVEQVLHGVDPDEDPVLADVHGIGAVLYAGLTGRWPGPTPIESLPGVPPLRGGRTPWPSRVVADVPRDLDDIAARALQTTEAPRPGGHYRTPAEVVAALSSALAAPLPLPSARPRRTGIRVIGVGLAVACAAGLAYLGIQLVLGLDSSPLTAPRSTPVPAVASTPATTASASSTDSVIPIVSATDFDPYGSTHRENPQLVPLALDANPATAWLTDHYATPTMGGKPGVGLLLDLGAPRPVSGVELNLVGNGTNLSLLATDDPTARVSTFTTMAQVAGAGSGVTLRVPRPVTTRYVVVWLTSLPAADGKYQGGIADVHVLG